MSFYDICISRYIFTQINVFRLQALQKKIFLLIGNNETPKGKTNEIMIISTVRAF